MNTKYQCPKCGCQAYETDKLSASGGLFSKLFDVQNKKFVLVICQECGYTEMYKQETSTLENIGDFIFGE